MYAPKHPLLWIVASVASLRNLVRADRSEIVSNLFLPFALVSVGSRLRATRVHLTRKIAFLSLSLCFPFSRSSSISHRRFGPPRVVERKAEIDFHRRVPRCRFLIGNCAATIDKPVEPEAERALRWNVYVALTAILYVEKRRIREDVARVESGESVAESLSLSFRNVNEKDR